MAATHPNRDRVHFTVVVPTHNRPDLLESAVNSVLEQRRIAVECVVVDDGSDVAVKEWDDPRVRVVRHEVPLGPAEARNTGIKHARGRYVSFLDDDDRYLPTRLDEVAEYVSPGVAVLCWSQAVGRPGQPGRLLYGNEFDQILDGPTPQIGTITLPLDDCPYFDPELVLNEDIDWWLRAAERCRFLTVPVALHIFREHQGPRITDRTRDRLRYSWLLIEKHAKYFACHPRALEFRLRRMGLIALSAGYRRHSLECFFNSFVTRPSPRSLGHLARAALIISLKWVRR